MAKQICDCDASYHDVGVHSPGWKSYVDDEPATRERLGSLRLAERRERTSA